MKKLALSFAFGSALALVACNGSGINPNDPNGTGEGLVKLAAYPDRVYFGDTHLHTSNSIDAFGFGVSLGPEDALRFARGEEVTSTGGLQAKLERPLDFLVISDHSGGLGATKALFEAPRFMIRDETLLRWYDMMHSGPQGRLKATTELIDLAGRQNLPKNLANPEQQKERTAKIWTNYTSVMERYNEPGKFTALLGFEYTLMPRGDNMHRVVIFRDGKARVDQVMPYDPGQGDAPVSLLWDYMDGYKKKTGGQVLAIPHNSNVSNGLMFQLTGPDKGPMKADYAKRRAAHEPLVEATQIKGDSEAHPFLSPNDEFADFGKAGWELGNLTMQNATTPDMHAGNYVREALKRGLLIEQRTGVNPYKLGMIGSTDSHTALSTGDENNFFGKHSGAEPTARRASDEQNLGTRKGRFGWHYLAGGYAAVWARGNTRAELFDAMMRKETYATTGPRMTVRFFGGWNFDGNTLTGRPSNTDWVKNAYASGVPMGGTLKPGKGTPSFIVSATKDPIGANIDRIQIVKGWIDAGGKMHEKVFDVAWSNPETRKMAPNGKIAPVGDTVDVAKASYTNTIGAANIFAVWKDREYRAGQKAFYYARVLEIPTPRWVLFDVIRYGAKLLPGTRVKDQERAYTSPIWVGAAQG